MAKSTAVRGGHEHQDGRRLWFVRHGETTGGSSQRYYGATDVPLSELGRMQVGRLRRIVEAWHLRALVHSPLSRAGESARIVAGLIETPPDEILSLEALREVDFGRLEGLDQKEIEAAYPGFFADWRAGRAQGYPGGETSEGFRRRIGAGIDDALARFPEGDLAFVVHRGVIKAALVHLIGLEWSQVRPWSLDLGSVTGLVALREGGWTLDRYNWIGDA